MWLNFLIFGIHLTEDKSLLLIQSLCDFCIIIKSISSIGYLAFPQFGGPNLWLLLGFFIWCSIASISIFTSPDFFSWSAASVYRLLFALFGHENLLNEFLTVLSLNLAPNEVSNRCPAPSSPPHPLYLFRYSHWFTPPSLLHRLHIRRVVPSKLLWTLAVASAKYLAYPLLEIPNLDKQCILYIIWTRKNICCKYFLVIFSVYFA